VSEANRIKRDAPKRCGSCLTASYADAALPMAGVMTKAAENDQGVRLAQASSEKPPARVPGFFFGGQARSKAVRVGDGIT